MLVTVAPMATRKTKFHGPTTKTVARNVRRLRENQGLSAAKLAARTSELGYDIPREGIQKIEAAAEGRPGARHINADELMVLALALRVNPNALLLPPTVNGNTELTGRGEVPADYAWLWADGQRPLSLDPDDNEILEFLARTRPRGVRTDDLSSAGAGAASVNRLFQQLTPQHPTQPVRPSELVDDREDSPPDGTDT